MFSLADIADIEIPEIRILDIGSMMVPGHPEVYSTLQDNGLARITGFEPNASECEKLNREYGPTNRYLPYVVYDGADATFHVTRRSGASSVFEPDAGMVGKFVQLPDLMQVIKTVNVSTCRLDDIEELEGGVDYIKADTQGAEFTIYKNAPKVVQTACIVHTEANLIPVYKDQHLFAEQDQILREYGFLFHKFHDSMGRTIRPFYNPRNPAATMSQVIQVNAVYVKDLRYLDQLPAEKLIKLAIILHDVYASYDLCHLVLDSYDKISGALIANTYLLRLQQEINSAGLKYPGSNNRHSDARDT